MSDVTEWAIVIIALAGLIVAVAAVLTTYTTRLQARLLERLHGTVDRLERKIGSLPCVRKPKGGGR